MEAKFHHVDPAPSDCITVTATKEEWREVIGRVLKTMELKEDAGDHLVHWLINQGVYE